MSFEIFHEEKKIGRIKMGRGSFTWWGKGKWEQNGERLSWSEFAAMMNKHFYGDD